MTCHISEVDQEIPRGDAVILVGNPNVGKSVIFSHLTGRYVEVSNFPGTTVEVTRGRMSVDGNTWPVIDTPGANSLIPRSEDERVTRDILLRECPRAVVQVADAKNLRRALLLTTQIVEMGLPLVLVLNMRDEAQIRGIAIDAAALARRLGIEVIQTTAVRGEGLDVLPEAIERARISHWQASYDGIIGEAAEEIKALLLPNVPYARALALMTLASDDLPPGIPSGSEEQIAAIRVRTAARYSIPLVYALNQQRLHCADCLIEGAVQQSQSMGRPLADWIGRMATHPIWGWPLLGIVLLALYEFVGVLGAGVLVNAIESTVFGQWINPWITHWIDVLLPIPLVRDLLVGEYGLVTMALTYGLAIVLPIVTTFFIAFSLLEDSGYLPRLAVMVNRPFQAMGLNGKAVLPMVLGLGCDTMATMTTRILETRKERLLVTLLLALGVPCSAQLGVILGMVSFISPTALAVWAGLVAGVMLAVGWVASKILPGETSDFIVEMPPIRAPRLDNIVFKTLARLEWYLKEVLPLFLLGTAILFVLDVTGALMLIERVAAPLIEELLGLPREATAAFLIGFLRRDYGAAGLFALARQGMMTTTQMTVSLVVITLFIPCIANFLMIVKEYGWKTAAWVTGFVVPLAFGVGGALNAAIRALGLAF